MKEKMAEEHIFTGSVNYDQVYPDISTSMSYFMAAKMVSLIKLQKLGLSANDEWNGGYFPLNHDWKGNFS